jgi:hypothetical protein
VIVRAQTHFPQIWAVDGTTLEALFRQVGLLREVDHVVLGGKLEAVLDLATNLPVHLWLDADPAANDKRFVERLQAMLPPQTLLVVDRGFYSFPFVDWLTEHKHGVVTRARALTALEVARVLHQSPRVRDRIVRLGRYRSSPSLQPLRLVEVEVNGRWHAYLTTVLDPEVLSVVDVVDLYARRWRIEEAFLLTKRLLGLSYLWSAPWRCRSGPLGCSTRCSST